MRVEVEQVSRRIIDAGEERKTILHRFILKQGGFGLQRISQRGNRGEQGRDEGSISVHAKRLTGGTIQVRRVATACRVHDVAFFLSYGYFVHRRPFCRSRSKEALASRCRGFNGIGLE